MASRSQMRLQQLTGSVADINSAAASYASPQLASAVAAADLEQVLAAMAGAIQRIHGENSSEVFNQAEGQFDTSKFDVNSAGVVSLDGSRVDIGVTTAIPVDIDATTLNMDAATSFEIMSLGNSRVESDALLIVSGGNGLRLESHGADKLRLESSEVTIYTDFIPDADDSYDLGNSLQRYAQAHIVSGTIHGLDVHTMAVGDLTNNEIVIAGSLGELEGDPNFRFDGSDLDIGAAGSEVFKVTVANGNTYIQGAIDADSTADIADTLTLSKATGTGLNVAANAIIGGDLIVNGTTTTVNSTTVTIDDPVFTLGGDTAPSTDDNKDRGIEFRYFDTAARLGFFGFDDSTGRFTALGDASNSAEVFSGTKLDFDIADLYADNINLSADLDVDGVANIDDLYVDNNLYVTGASDLSGNVRARADLTVDSLNQFEVVVPGASGLLSGSAAFTYNDTALAVGSSFSVQRASGVARASKLEVDSASDYIDVVSGDLTAVAAANLVLNHAAGGGVRFKDGSSAYGKIEYVASSDLALISETQLFLSSSSGNGIILDAGDGSIALQNANSDFGTIAEAGGVMYVQSSTELFASGSELRFDDDNRPASWGQGYIKLSDNATEWSDYEAALGGEHSLLKGITLAAAGSVNAGKWIKVYADGASTVSASSAIALSGFTALGSSIACATAVAASNGKAIDVYVNGQLMLEGASNDFEIDTVAGDIDFSFDIEGGDVIQIVVR